MKKLLIAIISLAAFTNNSFSQKIKPIVPIKNPIKTYPLEATEYLYVKVPYELLRLKPFAELYNDQGKLLIAEIITSPTLTMYTGDLPAGHYQLRIAWFGGAAIFPVIKNYIR